MKMVATNQVIIINIVPRKSYVAFLFYSCHEIFESSTLNCLAEQGYITLIPSLLFHCCPSTPLVILSSTHSLLSVRSSNNLFLVPSSYSAKGLSNNSKYIHLTLKPYLIILYIHHYFRKLLYKSPDVP